MEIANSVNPDQTAPLGFTLFDQAYLYKYFGQDMIQFYMHIFHKVPLLVIALEQNVTMHVNCFPRMQVTCTV